MKKHGTASPQATGNYIEFQVAVLRSLPHDIDPDVANDWMNNGHVLARILRETLKALPPSKSIKVLNLTCEGSWKASELVVRGNYNHYPTRWAIDERFPLQEHAPIERQVELVSFDWEPSFKRILAEFNRRGLERPTYEDALYFGIEYPEEQRQRSIIFLHEPVQDQEESHGYVLVLTGNIRDRCLDDSVALDFTRWSRNCLFAAVRPQKS